MIETNLKKSTLKKLVLDCCTKTAFSFNDKIYEQIDGVCMGSALGPVLANIIMTEVEKRVLPKLIEEGVIKFYIRYVDDTLVLVKEDKLDEVLQRFNAFDKNLKFTVDSFDDGVVHFLDILVHSNGETDVYSKSTNTGQYTHFDSYTPWGYKISWARALFNRASHICSNNALFQKQKLRISKILSWNGFPSYIRKKLIKRFTENVERKKNIQQQQDNTASEEIDKLILKIPYMGTIGDKLVKTMKRKVQSNLSRKIKIHVVYTTNKLSRFCGVKDSIPEEQQSNVIYSMQCPGCGEIYVGKTSCCFGKRIDEHGTRADQPLHQHLNNCDSFNYLVGLHSLPDLDTRGNVSSDSHIYQAVKQNSKIIARSDDWLTLAYMEPLFTKKLNATINHGEKAMRSLNLF